MNVMTNYRLDVGLCVDMEKKWAETKMLDKDLQRSMFN